MTRGAEPRYADTPYAQWIKRRLEAHGWQKQDLAVRLRDSSEGRLGDAGAERLVLRATAGKNVSAANRQLIASVLGEAEEEDDEADQEIARRQAELEAGLVAVTREVRRLANRVRVLEQPARPKKQAESRSPKRSAR